MPSRHTSIVAGLMALFSTANAVNWNFLTYYPSSGQQFTRFAGSMSVPTAPSSGGPYYLWPGLQPTDNSGVYQNVLDSRSAWYFGSGWCCSNPSLPWGGGQNVGAGDTVYFNNFKNDTAWTSITSSADGSGQAVTGFPLNDKNFNQAIFAIEIYDGSWTFGPLTFTDITIETTGGTDSSWCTNEPSNYGNTVYSKTGVTATTNDNGGVTCTIESIVLESPGS